MASSCVLTRRTFIRGISWSVLATSLLVRTQATGQMFLGSRDQHMSPHMGHGVSDLLAELEQTAGVDHRLATERRVERLELALQPMFQAMPKDRDGRLEPASVRYLLHRLFVQRHGWFVNGLENGGDTWNSSSPASVFKDHADDVHSIFENKLNETGFSLHQVAVFAATLEALVHTDSVERLQTAYYMLGYSHIEDTLSEETAREVIKTYMMLYVLSLSNDVLVSDFQEVSESILAIYPTWPDTETFANEVRSSVLSDVEGSERTTWNSTLQVLEEVGERYGRWQDKECHNLKAALIEMDDHGTGRVPLERFYESALTNTSWQFMESIPYLRQLGALDETDPEHKSVIITNYVYSPSNCVASSKFYSVCCIDECEELFGTLEKNIAAPEATPARLFTEVSMLASKTVQAPRELPSHLKTRLEEIAAHHGGTVPLHGRLFAQWMHHAYPRECPYPHLSGTTKPATAMAFMEETGVAVEVTFDEIWEVLENSNSKRADRSVHEKAVRQEMPWSTEEELFVCRQETSTQEEGHNAFGSMIRGVVPIAAVLSLAFQVLRLQTGETGSGIIDQKIYV